MHGTMGGVSLNFDSICCLASSALLVDPGRPQATAHLTGGAMRGCTLHVSWIIPDNTNISEITHFMIYIDRVNVYNKTNANDETFLSLSYLVRSCSPHNTSISIVNRCGREGPPSPTISTTSPEPVVCDGIVCEDNTTTGDSKFNSCLIV